MLDDVNDIEIETTVIRADPDKKLSGAWTKLPEEAPPTPLHNEWAMSSPPRPLVWMDLWRPLRVLDFLLKDVYQAGVQFEVPLWVREPLLWRTYWLVEAANWRPLSGLAYRIWCRLGKPGLYARAPFSR